MLLRSGGAIFASSIIVGPGRYVVSATSSGCQIISDTITIIGDVPPSFDLGPDIIIPCNTQHILNPTVTGGSGTYLYFWSNGSTDSLITVADGFYKLVIDFMLFSIDFNRYT